MRRCQVDDSEAAERRGRPSQQIVKDVDQEQPGKESRQGNPCRDHDAAKMVDPAIGTGSREDAKRYGDEYRKSKPDEGELQGCRETCQQFFRHGPAGAQRGPQSPFTRLRTYIVNCSTQLLSKPSD